MAGDEVLRRAAGHFRSENLQCVPREDRRPWRNPLLM